MAGDKASKRDATKIVYGCVYGAKSFIAQWQWDDNSL